MPGSFAAPAEIMQYAIDVARRGEGSVEPNPMVGAVVVDEHLHCLGAGWHARFGGPHAEIGALEEAGAQARGSTLYVTLEPCCHFGKTPPCTAAILAAGVRHVVVGLSDPFPQVAGRGIEQLRQAGLTVEVGLLESAVRRLNAPFLKLTNTGLPYVHAKWAMTLDGKIASRTGASRWISGAESRAIVHRLRGRMDAIVIGAATALADDPLLTARPAGPRVAARVVLDSQARLPVTSKLLQTLAEAPLIVAVADNAPGQQVADLRAAGAEVLTLPLERDADPAAAACIDLKALLAELGRRRFTNVLIEGGGELLGSFFDLELIDEVHVFVAPKLLGGAQAKSPLGGIGLPEPPALPQLADPIIEVCGGDVYVRGRVTSLKAPAAQREY